jgi:hypothetical protein
MLKVATCSSDEAASTGTVRFSDTVSGTGVFSNFDISWHGVLEPYVRPGNSG